MDGEYVAEWKSWNDLPWMSRASAAPEFQLCLRILQTAYTEGELDAFFKERLLDIAAEFAVPWVAVLHREQPWARIAEFGRQPFPHLPSQTLVDSLDRNAGVCLASHNSGGWTILASPLAPQSDCVDMLVIGGKGLHSKSMPAFMAVARAMGFALLGLNRHAQTTRRLTRLKATLQSSARFRGVTDSQTLLNTIAADAAQLLDCDRSSIFIWDRDARELVACPALGVDGNSIRIPDDRGIVAQSLRSGKTLLIDDAYADPRFNRQVDIASGYRTRTILCEPLVDPDGQVIGVFEAINKNTGVFDDDDVECLRNLTLHAAAALQSTQERERLSRRSLQLTEQATQAVQIVGNSPAIVAQRSTIDRLADTDLPVLVLGESGTGKEVVAQALHYRGRRREHPFVAVNCAALTETLLESELFGHEKGAFTDAHEARAGKFELAGGGTLFLDEIGDMSLGGQAKLLRVLEQKVVTRVGGSQPIRINVRVVAATNRNLAANVRDKKFREDLYYRLGVVTLELPPLRDRPEDILPLAEFFLERFTRQAGRRPLTIGMDARRRLQAHGWPGNVRELRNLMERVAFLCPRDRVEPEDLAFTLAAVQADSDADADLTTDLAEATSKFQESHIRRIVKRMQGNMSEAARLLGLHRSNLYRKMRHLGMSDASDEPA
jgi:Nif-specific regulatory protein